MYWLGLSKDSYDNLLDDVISTFHVIANIDFCICSLFLKLKILGSKFEEVKIYKKQLAPTHFSLSRSSLGYQMNSVELVLQWQDRWWIIKASYFNGRINDKGWL